MEGHACIAVGHERLNAFQDFTQDPTPVICDYSAAFSFFAVAFSGTRPLSSGLRYCPV